MQPKASAEDFLGRFREIISDPLNLLIRRVPNAGFVEDNLVYLHNGLRVPLSGPNAYYGEFSSILVANRGVHEPLEEFVFQEVLERLPRAPVMVELGAYWGHYSMWLKTARPEAAVRLIEPDAASLQAGVENFKLNGLKGKFLQAFVGKGHFQVDRYLKEQGLSKVDILHSDIQGYEVEMLEDCSDSLSNRVIDYLFISTHSQELHQRTTELLGQSDYRVEIESDFDYGTTSFDGFVFASSPAVKPRFKEFVPISRVRIAQTQPAGMLEYLSKVVRSTDA